MNFNGVIIEESLENKDVLGKVKIKKSMHHRTLKCAV